MGRPIKYDRDEILITIRDKADRRGVLAMNQKALAEELGISQFHFNRIIKTFVDSGTLKVIGNSRSGGAKTYLLAELTK